MSFCCGSFPTRALEVQFYATDMKDPDSKRKSKYTFITSKQFKLVWPVTRSSILLKNRYKQLFYVTGCLFNSNYIQQNYKEWKHDCIFPSCPAFSSFTFSHLMAACLQCMRVIYWSGIFRSYLRVVSEPGFYWISMNLHKRIWRFRKFYLYCFITQE